MKRLLFVCVLVFTGCGARNTLIVWHSSDWRDVIESNGTETVTMVDGTQVMFCCAMVNEDSDGTFEATYEAGNDQEPTNDVRVQMNQSNVDQEVLDISINPEASDQPSLSGVKENRWPYGVN
jgi:hypothetical protein